MANKEMKKYDNEQNNKEKMIFNIPNKLKLRGKVRSSAYCGGLCGGSAVCVLYARKECRAA
jgi:hypothetical protein